MLNRTVTPTSVHPRLINVKIGRKLAQKRHRSAVITLNHEDAIWLLRHAKIGAETWLKENADANIMNRAFYRDRIDTYAWLLATCEKVDDAALQCQAEFSL